MRVMTLGDIMQYVVPNSTTSEASYLHHCRMFSALWGTLEPMALTPMMVRAWVTQRQRQVSPATVRHELAFLSRVYQDWGVDNDTDYNPVRKVKQPRVDNTRRRVLSEDEERLLYEVMAAPDFSLVRFTLLTGLRRLELWTRTKADVLATDRLLYVRGKGGKQRWVPLVDEALQLADMFAAWWPTSDWLIMPRYTARAQAGGNWATLVWRPAMEAAGITGLEWRDLRRTYATRLHTRGAPLRCVQELLGHSSPVITQRYTTVTPDDLRRAAALA